MSGGLLVVLVVCGMTLGGVIFSSFKIRGWFRAAYDQFGVIKALVERGESYNNSHSQRLSQIEERLARASRLPTAEAAQQHIPGPEPLPGPGVGEPVEGDPHQIEAFLRQLDFDEDARGYLEIHMRRLVQTLNTVPPPGDGGAALELASYMQMAPVMSEVLGYSDVVAAYKGPLGESNIESVSAGGEVVFRCPVDKFDAELDKYPYPDGRFNLVIACELIEHLLQDPMHLVLESRRVLKEGGRLLITTPNTTNIDAVAKVLEQTANPQVYSKYSAETGQVPHVREYAPVEMRELFEAGGFEVETLFTAGESFDPPGWVEGFLKSQNLPTQLRGETIYCLGRKRSDRQIVRYPEFLYEAY